MFLFGSEPDPVINERAMSLQKTGKYEVKFAYWQRGDASSIHIPFAELLGDAAYIPIKVADPRGNFFRRAMLSLLFAWKFFRIARRHRANLKAVYCININMCAIASLALLFMRNVVLMHEFQDQYGSKLNFVLRKLYRWSARRVVLTLLQSKALIAYIDANELRSVSEPSMFLPPVPANWNYRHKAHKRAELVIGYFGYMRGQKILESLIEAVEKVQATGRDVRLKFAGTGDCAEFVKQRTANREFIEFGGKFDYHTEYLGLFSSVDAIFAVFPQSVANFKTHVARRVAEAFASNMPVIVCKGTYMAKLVAEYDCGWSADEASTTELVQLLTHLFDNRQELDLADIAPQASAEWKFEHYEAQFLTAVSAVLGTN